MIGSDNRLKRQMRTLKLIDPYFSVLRFSVGKTVTEKCRTENFAQQYADSSSLESISERRRY
jgi:hypothetical protein